MMVWRKKEMTKVCIRIWMEHLKMDSLLSNCSIIVPERGMKVFPVARVLLSA